MPGDSGSAGDLPSSGVMPGTDHVERRVADPAETRAASRAWWDFHASSYQDEHAADLGAASFLWCPEGVTEDEARLLGDVAGRDVLEVGCGAAQCARWLTVRGARVIGTDISAAQLVHSRELDRARGTRVPVVQADAESLPFAGGSFDLACSAYGAVPFVADSAAVMREVARVLRPGGRWVFSVGHPMRWCFPDDPSEGGLTVETSYFDRRAYVEETADGRATYVEHHRTLGDRVREIVGAGFRVVDLVEPEWAEGHESSYAQWSGLRGRLVPGTTIWVTERL
ncbi:MAG TPA: class I SAM-dependent methyltransferase [Mycobacteriales bacterium]|nr:class I SAM-dependent methyltransferase [Mycobacteriales bacterium]